jgi:oxygen-dependent protoporphyrinogen oxidase
MKDVVIVGGGLAGMSAAWRLRHWDTVLLESDHRVGGRVRSERRGQYWLNWGAHVFAGHGTSTDALLNEVGITAVAVPGSLTNVSMNGKFIRSGRIETYPFRLPLSLSARAAVITKGLKVGSGVLRYAKVVRQRAGESGTARQQRIYNFENQRSFQDFIGHIPEDAAALFETTVMRSGGDMDEISAGAGIGYFSLVWNVGQGLNRGIVGGPSTLAEAISVALGDRVELGAEVQEIVHKSDSVVVRYRQDGTDREVEGRCVVLATPATVSHRVAVDLPADVREALGKVVYGPHVSTAFLTNETSPRPWDDLYAIACPKRSFAIALNQASIVRGAESVRQPGGSMMTFCSATAAGQVGRGNRRHPPDRPRPSPRIWLRRHRGRGGGVTVEGRFPLLLSRPGQAAADPHAPVQPGLPSWRLPRQPLHRIGYHHGFLCGSGSRQFAGHRTSARPPLLAHRHPSTASRHHLERIS